MDLKLGVLGHHAVVPRVGMLWPLAPWIATLLSDHSRLHFPGGAEACPLLLHLCNF